MSKKELWRQYLVKTNPRPLYGFLWKPDLKPLPSIVDRVGNRKYLLPEDLLVEDLLAHAEKVLAANSGWKSDFPQAISPYLGVPWLEAIIGCSIRVRQDKFWAEPSTAPYELLLGLKFDPENKWLRRLLVLHQELVWYAGRHFFPVSLPLMSGPLDLIVAWRGPEQLRFDLLERPNLVKEAVGKLSKLWLKVAQLLMKMTPPFADGWFTRMNIFMPWRAATLQVDTGSFLSAQVYREFGLPFDQALVVSIPGQTYHTHSTAAHLLPMISRLKYLRCLEITIDPYGPSRDELKPIIEDCQKRVPIMLAVWNEADFRWAAQTFQPGGLAVVLIKMELDGKVEYEQLLREVLPGGNKDVIRDDDGTAEIITGRFCFSSPLVLAGMIL